MALPIILTTAGVTPTDPATLRAQSVAIAETLSPGLTANLPALLIEDLASTAVGAETVLDAARADLINSVTPYGANAFILNQLGQIYGVQQGIGSNTSVYVVFTGPAGFVIPVGFQVGDGTYSYIVQDGGIIGTSGVTVPLYCLATVSGTWAVPANTVNALQTSVPSTIMITVTNPTDGVPGVGAQSLDDYQAQVIQAGSSMAQGMTTFLKTQLGKVVGVQSRLVSIRQVSGGWEVICGGGDPYQVAYAIFTALFDLPTLKSSTINITAITNANPGVATTDLNHGYATGQVFQINGATGITGINGVNLTATVLTEKTFSIGINTTSSGSYTGGGILTPNLRNVSVSINDYPDTYTIPFVNPPLQTVTISMLWNTISTNLISPVSIAQAANPAIVNYINSIVVGQPINVFELQEVFVQSVSSLIPATQISRMVFTVNINGVTTAPTTGTGLIYGDPESYFFAQTTGITIAQG